MIMSSQTNNNDINDEDNESNYDKKQVKKS